MNSDNPLAVSEIERFSASDSVVPPQRVLWRQLRAVAEQRRADREEADDRVAAERGRLAEVICHLAELNHQLAGLAVRLEDLATRFQRPDVKEASELLVALVMKDEQAMRRAGAEVLYHLSERYDPDVATVMELVGSIPVEGIEYRKVRETILPGVRLNGDLVQRARVILSVPKTEKPRGEE